MSEKEEEFKTKGTLKVGFYKDGNMCKCGDQIDVTKDLLDKGYFVKGTKMPESVISKPSDAKPKKKTKTKKTKETIEEIEG